MSELEYDPTVEGLMTEVYEDLSYPEFKEPKFITVEQADQMIRFVILFVDEDSPFAGIRDYDKRVESCYEVVKPENIVKQHIEESRYDYRQILKRYLMLNSSYLFEEWISTKLDFHHNSVYLGTSFHQFSDPEKAGNLKIRIKGQRGDDMKKLLDIENSLFKSKKTQKAVIRAANESSLLGYAEKYAQEIDLNEE